MERRRSRAVLYQLSGHLQKQDKTKSKLKINNVRPSSSFDVIRIDLVLARGYIRPPLPQHFTPKCKTIVRVGLKQPRNICIYIGMLEGRSCPWQTMSQHVFCDATIHKYAVTSLLQQYLSATAVHMCRYLLVQRAISYPAYTETFLPFSGSQNAVTV